MPGRSLPHRGRRRRVCELAGLAALALLAALLAAYRPSLSPPELHPRSIEYAQATAQLLVDTPVSNLNDSRQNAVSPAKSALAYVQFLHVDAVRAALGRAVGLRNRDVAVAGPFTVLLNQNSFLTVARGLYSPPTDGRYRLLADVDGARPMLSLYSQAPTVREAVTLVDTARSLLVQRAAGRPSSAIVDAGQRVVLRPLGAATGSVVVDASARLELMGFCSILVLLIGGSLLCARGRRRRSAADSVAELDRLEDPAPPSDDWPHTRRLLPWSLAAFVVMIYLVPFDAIKLPVNLPLDSNLDRPVLVAMVLLWFSSLAVVSGAARPRVKLTRIHVAMLVFFAVACLTVALNGGLLLTMGDLTLSMKKVALLLAYIIFFAIASSVLRPREVPRFAALMVSLGVMLAVATVVEFRTHYNVFYDMWSRVLAVTLPVDLDVADGIGRLTVDGPTNEPLELAALLAMTLPFALVGAITSTTRRRRLLYAVAVGVLIAGGLATARKTSVVAPLAAIGVLLAYRPRSVGRALLRLGVPLLVVVHLISPGSLGSVLSELQPGHFNTVTTTTDRTKRYDATRPDIMRRPLLGRGFQSYDPHKYRILDNQYLDLLICTGLIGLALYGAIFAAMMLAAHPVIRGPDPARAALALAGSSAVAVILVANMLFDVISFPHVPYLLFFIAAMILALREPSPGARSTAAGRRRSGMPTERPVGVAPPAAAPALTS